MTNLSINFCETEFKNPLVIASGPFGNGREYSEYFPLDIVGAITSKSVTREPRDGNPSSRVVRTSSGVLNAIGLQNTGSKAFIADDLPFLQAAGTHILVNISGSTIDEYVGIAAALDGQVWGLEANISCPNVEGEGMAFGQDPEVAAAITAAMRKVTKKSKLIVKLTPNVTDIAGIASAVEAAGADAISLINTVSAMRINPATRKFVIANKTAGLSGPAILPVAIRCVYQVAQAVKIPIIGMGGVSSGLDVAEVMLAGASLVGIGTVLMSDPDNDAPVRILRELEGYCEEQGIKDVTELIGAVR